MSTLKSVKLFTALNRRFFCEGSVILNKCPELYKKRGLLGMPLKRASRKAQKRRNVPLKATDVDEQLWLQSLNPENIKLYRKTSFGSFRRISTNKLLERLKMLFPVLFGAENVRNFTEVSPKEKSVSDSSLEGENDFDPSCVSEFLVKNMLSFPMLRSKCENSLTMLLKDERDAFANVDSTVFPSVTKVLNETMSDEARLKLNVWKDRMIKTLGKEEFFKYHQDPEVALCNFQCSKIFIQTPRKQKQIIVDLIHKGNKFHASLRKYLESGDEKLIAIDSDIEGCWNSLEKLLPDISNVLMVEESVSHPVLMYRGVVDCVASYRDGPCVIEWKKSDRKKTSLAATYDAPIQLCAYLGALAWRKNPSQTAVKNGLVVTAYNDGSPATIFPMDMECCEFYWGVWLRRLQNYWAKRCPKLGRRETPA